MPNRRCETIELQGWNIVDPSEVSSRLTTINGKWIADNNQWMWTPKFLSQLAEDGYSISIESVEMWIAENFQRLLNSEYSNYFTDTIMSFWSVDLRGRSFSVLSTVSSRVDYMRQNRVFNAAEVVVVENPRRAEAGSSLLIPEVEEPRENYFAWRASRFRNGNLEIQVQYAGDPQDDWSPTFGSREFYQLMNYTYSPASVEFLSAEFENHELYFGLELELSTQLSPRELQRINTEVEPCRPIWFYMKQDSSITGRYNNRMELVTFPMTPRRMRAEFRILFQKIESLARDAGYRIDDLFDLSTDLTNGIHIHVNKTAFVQHSMNDHAHKYRFIAAFNLWESTNLDFYQQISRRPGPIRENRFCYIHPGLDGRTVARRLKEGPVHADRHAACHEGGATVEVRLFQGIVDLPHILTCIEIVQAMFEYSQYAPRSKYNKEFANEFINWVMKAPGFKRAKEVLAQCA